MTDGDNIIIILDRRYSNTYDNVENKYDRRQYNYLWQVMLKTNRIEGDNIIIILGNTTQGSEEQWRHQDTGKYQTLIYLLIIAETNNSM